MCVPTVGARVCHSDVLVICLVSVVFPWGGSRGEGASASTLEFSDLDVKCIQ